MTREEKIKIAIEKGYTCNPDTGEVFGITGKVMNNLNKMGYNQLIFIYNKKNYHLYSHQFIYYWVFKKVVDCLDHINGIKNDNRINNLRSVSIQENNYNRKKIKGYQKNQNCSTYTAWIKVNKQRIYLGSFKDKEKASKAYFEAKKLYHSI